jgi:hypothetical protein
MFKKQNFPIEVEDEDKLKVFKNTKKLGLHRVATHVVVFRCIDTISWIIRHVDLDNRYIIYSKGKPITSFHVSNLASYYYLERGSLLLDEELIKKFPHKEKYLTKILYKLDKTFKIISSCDYPTTSLRTPYQYAIEFICMLYGEHDASKFNLSLMPLIYYYT